MKYLVSEPALKWRPAFPGGILQLPDEQSWTQRGLQCCIGSHHWQEEDCGALVEVNWSITVQSCCICRGKKIPLRFLIKLKLITLCPTAVLLSISSTFWGNRKESYLSTWALWTSGLVPLVWPTTRWGWKLNTLLWSFGFPTVIWAQNPCPCWVPSCLLGFTFCSTLSLTTWYKFLQCNLQSPVFLWKVEREKKYLPNKSFYLGVKGYCQKSEKALTAG